MSVFAPIDTLIIVCCHAIWLGEREPSSIDKESVVEDRWLLESFQEGESATFIKHIEAGLDTLHSHQDAILVFSGGPTKPDRTKLSEADTYIDFLVANMQHKLHGHCMDRIFAESFATDSLQNVLFSLTSYPRFVHEFRCHRGAHLAPSPTAVPQETSPSPHHLIVIGHAFKRLRFEQLHLPALRYPTDESRFTYIGIDPPFDAQRMQAIKAGDAERGYGAWEHDLYGTGALLAGKRVARGWTRERLEELVGWWRDDVEALCVSDEQRRAQVEQIIAFVHRRERDFPLTAPWS